MKQFYFLRRWDDELKMYVHCSEEFSTPESAFTMALYRSEYEGAYIQVYRSAVDPAYSEYLATFSPEVNHKCYGFIVPRSDRPFLWGHFKTVRGALRSLRRTDSFECLILDPVNDSILRYKRLDFDSPWKRVEVENMRFSVVSYEWHRGVE